MRHFLGLMMADSSAPFVVACTSPTAPTVQAEPIAVRGNLAGRIGPTIDFVGIPLGTRKSAFVQITSTGSAAITVTSVSVPAGYSVTFPSGPPLRIQPGQTQNVTITLAPTRLETYNGNVVVRSDATSGTNTVAVSGTGVARVSFGAGTFIVGRDIQPGRYDTSAAYSGANPSACSLASFNVVGQQIGGIGTLAGALQQVVDIPAFVYSVSSPAACAWNRMRDFQSLSPSSTILSGVSTTVTVQPGDSGFLTHGCVWTLQH